VLLQQSEPVLHLTHTVEQVLEHHELAVERDHAVGLLGQVALIVLLEGDRLQSVEAVFKVLGDFRGLRTVGQDCEQRFV